MKFHEVILYGRSGCHKCHHYIHLLKKHQVEFTFKDVTKSVKAQLELDNFFTTGIGKIPTFIINGKKIRNPKDEELLKRLLINE